MGKSRVKPLRGGVSVPKLELTAATLAIQINELITKELQFRLNIDSLHFWTDSIIVLKYILNESRRFVTFVANRVAVIREGSEPSQWKYIKSEINPADHASRGIDPSEKDKLETWRNGPAFLWKNTDEWPTQPPEASAALLDNDEGVRKEKLTVNTAVARSNFWSSLFQRYSSWNKLVQTVAWIIRACEKWRKLCSDKNQAQTTCQLNQPLSVSDMRAARRKNVNVVQRESYPEEFEFANSPTKSVRRKGKLAALKPVVVEGILRVGGRLSRSELPHDAKHPMIIPGKHRITELFIFHVHQTNGHVGVQQVLARTRQQFWIVNGVSSIRTVLNRCHKCKRQSARLGMQVTAPLPVVRVSSDSHRLIYPFAAVGLDYFGPFYVKHGPVTRTTSKNPTLNKRYGCIFTCLRYRAVHIEVAHNLTTDSFINAVLRFVARRGPPRIVYSDNGSNFTGAEPDILRALEAWDQERIQKDLCKRDIEWKFNPPAASHQGGVWERLIRSIRRIDDETLATFFAEVEKIMNDRPITSVSNDPNDLEALTPNDVLLLRKNPCVAPDDFASVDKYRTRWKHVQLLANRFWQRWIREYLPTLQERQKWLDEQPNLRKGDLVLVADHNVPRGKWPKGLVEQTYPDSDQVVRRVLVRTAAGVVQRDVRKLCLLEENLLKLLEQQSLHSKKTTTQL